MLTSFKIGGLTTISGKDTVFFRLVQVGSCQGTETSHPRFSKRGKLDVLALARPVAGGGAGGGWLGRGSTNEFLTAQNIWDQALASLAWCG